jgi:hypothetical protein
MTRQNGFTPDRQPDRRPGGLSAGGRAVLPLLPLLAAWTSLTGCAGYQIGNQSLYPADVRTVYVPMVESATWASGSPRR